MHTPTCTPTAQIVVHEAKDAASLARNIPSEGLSTSAVPSTLKPVGAGLARCRPLRAGDLYMWVCVHHSMRAMMRIPVFFVSMRFQRNERPPKTASGQTSPHTKRKQKGAHVHPLTCTHARPYGYTYIYMDIQFAWGRRRGPRGEAGEQRRSHHRHLSQQPNSTR